MPADDDYDRNSGITLTLGTAAMLSVAMLPCCRDNQLTYSDLAAGAAFVMTLVPFIGGYVNATRYERSRNQPEGDKVLSAEWHDTLKEYVDE